MAEMWQENTRHRESIRILKAKLHERGNVDMWRKVALERGDTLDVVRDKCATLKTQLQDANRKLAAMGGITTSELVEVWARRANPPDAKTLERSLEQLDWDLLEDHEARIYEDWKETQNDALDIGVQ